MKKFTAFILTFSLLTLAGPALAAETVHVSVNGLVCDFCAQALEKVFGKEDSVEDIDVDLNTKIITIDFKDGQAMSDEEIEYLVQDSGYDVENIHHVTQILCFSSYKGG